MVGSFPPKASLDVSVHHGRRWAHLPESTQVSQCESLVKTGHLGNSFLENTHSLCALALGNGVCRGLYAATGAHSKPRYPDGHAQLGLAPPQYV